MRFVNDSPAIFKQSQMPAAGKGQRVMKILGVFPGLVALCLPVALSAQESPPARILVDAGEACEIAIDGKVVGKVQASSPKAFDVFPGDHIVECFFTATPSTYRRSVVKAVRGQQTLVLFDRADKGEPQTREPEDAVKAGGTAAQPVPAAPDPIDELHDKLKGLWIDNRWMLPGNAKVIEFLLIEPPPTRYCWTSLGHGAPTSCEFTLSEGRLSVKTQTWKGTYRFDFDVTEGNYGIEYYLRRSSEEDFVQWPFSEIGRRNTCESFGTVDFTGSWEGIPDGSALLELAPYGSCSIYLGGERSDGGSCRWKQAGLAAVIRFQMGDNSAHFVLWQECELDSQARVVGLGNVGFKKAFLISEPRSPYPSEPQSYSTGLFRRR